MFPWWSVANDDDPAAPRERAIAWVKGPYARLAAMTAGYGDAKRVESLLNCVRDAIDAFGVEQWDSPVEFEAWLRGVLRGCAAGS